MDKNIQNLKFVEIDSSLKGYKEFIVTYNCDGKPVKDFIFINEKEGLKKSDYLKLAQKEFKPNPKAIKGATGVSSLSLKIIAACAGVAAITLGGLFTWKMLTNNPITPEPQPEPVVQEYTVKWVDEDGTLMDEEVYKKGELPSYKGDYHDKAGIFKDDGEEYMHFQEGWKEDVNTPITEDTTFHAVYSDRLMVTTMTAEITEDDLASFTDALPIGFGFVGTVNHIDWDDGQSGEDDKYKTYHFYTQPGTYTIKIYGNVKNIFTDPDDPEGYRPINTEGDYCITSVNCGCSYDGKNYIGGFVPFDSKLSSWVVSSSVTELNTYLFEVTLENFTFDVNSRCRYINSVSDVFETFTVPNTVLKINEPAFRNCTNLKHVYFESNSRCSVIEGLVFDEAESLLSIELPQSLTEIGAFAFRGCSALESIVIPKSVTLVDSWAFQGCSELNEVIFEESDNVVRIGAQAFQGCNSITKLIPPINFYNEDYEGSFAETTIDTLTVPEGTEEIPYCAYKSAKINKIKFPNSLTKIDRGAFEVATINEMNLSDTNIESIGDNAFQNVNGIDSISLPSSLKSIGEHSFSSLIKVKTIEFADESQISEISHCAFYYCEELVNFELPKSVAKLDSEAFSMCSKLPSFSIKNNPRIDTIPDACFFNCTSLSTFEFNDTVTTIERSAFASAGLTSIKLPSSIIYIGEGAFADNSSLEFIDLTSFDTDSSLKIPSIQPTTFPETIKFKVANEKTKAAFLNAPVWSEMQESRFIVA